MGPACNLVPAHSQFRDQFSEGPPLATLAQAIALPTDFSARLASFAGLPSWIALYQLHIQLRAHSAAIALPTDFSAKLARNTQLILAEETGITRVGGCGDWLVVLNVRSGVQLVQCR